MTKSFTAGERRGMIALLLILAAIISTLYLFNNKGCDETLPLTDSISATTQHIFSDTARESKSTKKKKNKKYKPKKQAPTRDPLSQPVPYETR